jgi:hypothetical protein
MVTAVAVMATGAAQARTEVTPYIEADQTFVANLKGGGSGGSDVLTYTSLAVGVDASAINRRVEAQASVRYEHQFGWGSVAPDSDILSAIARARYSVIPGRLSLEAGALATRVRTDGFGSANNSLITAGDATTNIYSLYAGPTYTGEIGDMFVKAAYRLGYSRIDDNASFSGGNVINLNRFDESVYQSATASIGQQPGGYLPVGWSLGAGWDHEDATQLNQRYDDKWVRGDITVPVSNGLALVGGIGYESIKISQRPVLVDENGDPVIGGNGRLVTDPASPRIIAYNVDGLIWDAGVLWRPSRRTSLEARVGRRYDSMHYVGSFSWRATPSSLLKIAYFDTIDSFGRAMQGNLIALPTTGFNVVRNPFSGDLTGCVGGENGGRCFNEALAAISGSNYRHRGFQALYSWQGGRWNWGVGAGLSQRKFIAPESSIFASVNGAKDHYYYADLFAGYKLDMMSNIGANAYANYYDAGISGVDVTNYGVYGTYDRRFGRRLSARAALGLDAISAADLETIVTLLGQVGLRYEF